MDRTRFEKIGYIASLLLIAAPALLFAVEGPVVSEEHTAHEMTQLVIELAVILFATWIGGKLAEKIHLPKVIGQLITGIIIGPFLLGSIGIPGFPEGLFPVMEGTIPVSPLIYAISNLAAIILLFLAGLETDLALFLRYAGKGSLVGVGGVLVSFLAGNWLTTLYTGLPMSHPMALFMGTLSVATSVGITASILSDQKKMDSPSGVVILSAAVIDDVLAIIILAVVLGIAGMGAEDGVPTGFAAIAGVAGRAVAVWLFFTIIGLVFARQIGRLLKNVFKEQSLMTVMALALALLMAGIFEGAGLSMIIGAYIVGLTLSNTDLAFVIPNRLKTLYDFFIPVFFAVSGMMVNLRAIASWEVIGFGLLFTAVTIVAKLIGAGGPSLLLNFNLRGAARIGFGMVPRGEVTLIVAGIGMGAGIISEQLFGVTLLMTILSTIIAPPILNRLLRSSKSGQRVTDTGIEKTETSFSFHSPEFAHLVLGNFTSEMEKEGFFVSTMEHGEEVIQLRKDDIFISLYLSSDGNATFLSRSEDVNLFKTALYESLLSVNKAAAELQTVIKPSELAQSISEGTSGGSFDIMPYTGESQIIMELNADTKEDLIREMVQLADNARLIDNAAEVLEDVLERERSMTTGLAQGVALPHAKTNGVRKMSFLIGIKKDGLDFKALDGQPSRIFAMLLTPKQGHGPHIQLMSTITGLLNKEEVREKLLNASGPAEVMGILASAQKKYKK